MTYALAAATHLSPATGPHSSTATPQRPKTKPSSKLAEPSPWPASSLTNVARSLFRGLVPVPERTEKTAVKAGDRFSDEHGNMRVMAVAQGYAMCRRTGCTPFVRTVAEVAAQMHDGPGANPTGPTPGTEGADTSMEAEPRSDSTSLDAILEPPGAH